MRTEHVLEYSIGELDFPTRSANAIIAFVLNRQSHHIGKEELAAAYRSITVREVIDAINTSKKHYLPYATEQRFIDFLIAHGLTALDWEKLPDKTVTMELLKQFPRKELLKVPVRFLGVSRSFLDVIHHEIASTNPVQKLTIGETLVLTDHPRALDALRKQLLQYSIKGYRALYDRFCELGFMESDGVFMRLAALQDEIEAFAGKYGLNRTEAALVLRIARAEGWIE